MSLLEFIAKKDVDQKLYEDRTVCLCFYRNAFNHFEQQTLMRLALLVNKDPGCHIKIHQ